MKYFEKNSKNVDILTGFWLQYSPMSIAIWMQTTRMDSKIQQFMRKFQVDATADKVKYLARAFTRDWFHSILTVFVKDSGWKKLFRQSLKKLRIGVHVFEQGRIAKFLHSRTQGRGLRLDEEFIREPSL